MYTYLDPDTGEIYRYILNYGETNSKGIVNTLYKDGNASDREYWIYADDDSIEAEIVYDPDQNAFIYVKTVYNTKEQDLPPKGYVFTAPGE